MILTLQEAKQAARVLHDDDDLLIQSYADAAQVWIERVTGAVFDPAPEDVKQIARLLVAHWYDNRHAVGEEKAETPLGVRSLIATRRRFAHGVVDAP